MKLQAPLSLVPVLALTLCIGSLTAPALSAREFVDVQGRKLDGELVGVNGTQASIKRTADGRVFPIEIGTLSAADQQFIKESAGKIRYSFDVKTAKERLGKTKTKDGIYTMESEEWAYKLTLTNRSSGDVGPFRVDYWLFRRDDDGKNKMAPRVQSSGSTEVAGIRKGASQLVQTKSYILNKEQLQADYIYADGARNTRKDSAGGLAVRFFQGDQEIFQWASDGDLLALAKGNVEKSASESAQ